MTHHNSITCAFFPDPWRSAWHQYHPFLEHLALELKACGCQITRTPENPTPTWMYKVRHVVDVVHFHWPEKFYQTGTKYRVGIGLARLWRFLMQVRVHNLKLVWTVHDLYPHSTYYSRYPIWAHRYARHLLCRYSDAIVVNCETARDLVTREFAPSAEVTVVELGNYSGFYPSHINRETARNYLGLSSEHVAFLMFGTMRPNRNPVQVVNAFRRLENSRARLFVVGQGHSPLRDEVERSAWGDWRIRVFPYIIDNESVSTYFKACDVVVMPGKCYTTSAVIMLALSYGKPVICSAGGCARDMAGDAGIYYDPESQDELLEVMQQAMRRDLKQLGAIAFQRSRLFTWQLAAEKLIALYRSILK